MARFKTLLVIIITLALFLFACKTKEEAEVVEIPEREKLEPPEKEEDITVKDYSEIPVREERVSLELIEKEDIESHEENQFFVIVGSFEYKENAEQFIRQINEQGFDAFMLLTDFGFHRVSVNSFEKEADARESVQKIRSNYEEYNDTWLLIKR